jgi:hypothetical protein
MSEPAGQVAANDLARPSSRAATTNSITESRAEGAITSRDNDSHDSPVGELTFSPSCHLAFSNERLVHVFLGVEPAIDLHGARLQTKGLKTLRHVELLCGLVFHIDA